MSTEPHHQDMEQAYYRTDSSPPWGHRCSQSRLATSGYSCLPPLPQGCTHHHAQQSCVCTLTQLKNIVAHTCSPSYGCPGTRVKGHLVVHHLMKLNPGEEGVGESQWGSPTLASSAQAPFHITQLLHPSIVPRDAPSASRLGNEAPEGRSSQRTGC